MSGHAAGKPAHVISPSGPDPEQGLSARKAEKRAAEHGGSQSGSDRGRPHSEPPRPQLTSGLCQTRRYSLPHTHDMIAMPSLQLSLTKIGEDDNESLPAIEALSPAATEIDDPEAQDIMDQIQRRGIKIRDFAFSPPYTRSPSNPPSIEAIPIASTSTAPVVTLTSVPAPTRTTEVFDPYKGLIEVDYRWAQTDRIFPVTGKTLRRLLDIAWLTHDELSTRGHPLDVAALQAHDTHRAAAKEANGGVEAYPWRPLVAEGTPPPTMEERRIMRENCGGLWKQRDRMMASKEAREEWRRKEEEDAAQKKREFEEREREKERDRKRRGKRKMEDGADIDYRKEELEDETNSSCGPKRIRLSPSEDGEGVLSSQDTYTGSLLPPKKQYPAPLQAYNPKLYPDAASIIQASSQSQPRPSFPDTPPAIDRTDTPPSFDDGEGDLKHHAQRLVHPKKNGRGLGLGRTQTFTDFY